MNLGELINQKLMELEDQKNPLNELKGGRLVSELKVDDQVVTALKVISKRLQRTKDGKHYLLLTLSDRSGALRAVDWNNAKHNDETIFTGSVIRVSGKISMFDSRQQLVIGISPESVKILDEGDYDPKKFIEITSRNVRVLYDKLISAIGEISNEKIKSLLREFFVIDEKFTAKFIDSPAAATVHHAYKGGLLEHSIDVMEIAKKMTEVYNNVTLDRDLLIAGALLHDIGKIKQYSIKSSGIESTDEGELVGHIAIGMNMLNDYSKKVKDFPPDILIELEHIILSHHGEFEWGSPILPKTTEALIIHSADNLDSKVAQFREYAEKAQEGRNDDENGWSDYNKFLSRRVRVKGVKTNGNDE